MNDIELSLFWAKLGDGKYPEDAHPVICHLLDVGSVALELWEHGLHSGFRSWLAGVLNMTDEAAGRWMAFAIAMHDIGKVSPPFQRKSDEAVLKLADAGFRFPPAPTRASAHGVVSAGVLPSLWQSEYGVPEAFGRKLAHAVGGHQSHPRGNRPAAAVGVVMPLSYSIALLPFEPRPKGSGVPGSAFLTDWAW